MNARHWVIGWLLIVSMMLIMIVGVVVYVDPYFHYHKPHTSQFYYTLNNQRSQNDGIVKHFDYNALVTGTSMTENFKCTEVDELFGVNSIKVSYSGGTYKETGDNLRRALIHNSDLKLVIRGLHSEYFVNAADSMRDELGSYPTYLYDDNLFNDVYYVFNKDVIFARIYEMMRGWLKGDEPGITSFDEYSRWSDYDYSFGINAVSKDGVSYSGAGFPVHLSEEERNTVYDNITQNVTSLAEEYPDVEFYYFITPLSILNWKKYVEDGTIYRQIEAEEYVIELMLQYDNIKLFSLNLCENVITDINNYKDEDHYGEWVNSYILQCMSDGRYQLTKDNYQEYIMNEYDLLIHYDYAGLNDQVDYEDDKKAAIILLNQ